MFSFLYLDEGHAFTFLWIRSLDTKSSCSLIACEKVQPLSSSPSFWGLVLQITPLEMSSLGRLNISLLKPNNLKSLTFSFDAVFGTAELIPSHKTVNLKYLPVSSALHQGADWSWWGLGESRGKEHARKQKTEEVLHHSACISEQEGVVVTFHHRPRPGICISWVGVLPCSSEKKERRGRSLYFYKCPSHSGPQLYNTMTVLPVH